MFLVEKFFSEILGTPIVAEDSTRPIGRILNVLIHPENGQVVAFSLDFSFQRIIVPMDIRGWFREVVIGRSDDVLSADDVVRVREVLNMDVMIFKNCVFSKNGKNSAKNSESYLGRVHDFSINIEQMMLSKILVAKSVLGLVRFQQRIIPFSQIVEIRKERIIVKYDFGEEKVIKREAELAAIG